MKAHDHLLGLMADYGFDQAAKKPNGEAVYLKRLDYRPGELGTCPSPEISIRYYPYFADGSDVRKYLVPIRPEYHKKLFIEYDYPGRQRTIYESLGQLVVEGNAIKKAYLCHSKTKSIHGGDLLLFYRSHDRKEITSLCVAEKILIAEGDVNVIMGIVSKRTVYSIEELRRLLSKPLTIILFRWHFDLPRPLRLGELIAGSVLKGAPQSIMNLSNEQYEWIKKKGGLNEHFAVG
jgi:hypothetical protein